MNSIRPQSVLQALAFCFLLLLLPCALLAQGNSGTILGVVSDTTGASVAQASVTITNIDTQAKQTVTSTSKGDYQFVGLPAGTYKLTVSATGFKAELRSGVQLTVGASATVALTLQPGDVSETVVVTDQAPQVDTTTAAVGGVVGGHEIRQLPLNGRDWLQLATLQAGVSGGLGQQSTQGSPTNSRAARGNGENLYITGNRPTENLYLVDGLTVNDYANSSPGSGLNVNLGVDAIREFAVLTSGFSAQYGMTSGGVVNATFKSGTNSLHGTAFGFFRNSALDTRNYFDGPDKPPFHRYQFGAAVGGPIKKDKVFFFGNYEQLNQALSISENSLTLSDGARTGIVPNPGGAGNITVAIDPAIQPFLALFPAANGIDNGDGTAFYNFAGAQTGNEHYAVGKLDFNLSSTTTLSTSVQWDNASLLAPDPFNQKLTGSPSNHVNGIASLQHFFTPNLLNTARLGLSHTFASDSEDVSALQPIATDTSLGFLAGKPSGVLTAGPLVTAGGLGASGADSFHFITYQGDDDLNYIHGSHSIQGGFNFERIADDFSSVNLPFGEFDFGSVQDLLQNVPQTFLTDFPGTNGARTLRTDIYGAYLQDVYRATHRLTITAGLRYEYNTPVIESNGKVATLTHLSDSTLRLGGSFVGNGNHLRFAPRVGVAYDPFGNGKTAVRASFGIYDVMLLPYLFVNRTHGAPFYVTGVAQNPPASSFPIDGLGLLTNDTTSEEVVYVQQNPPRGYNQAWNLTVQQQLSPSMALMVGYVGNHAVHVPINIDDMNQVPLSQVSINANGRLMFPIPPGGSTSKIQRVNSTYGRIEGMTFTDYSIYHGLLANLSRRMSHGFNFQVAYTWSKSMDEGSSTFSDNEYTNTIGPSYSFDLKLQKAVSDYNITNNTVINGQWDIPVSGSFGKTEKAVLGGWQLGSIFQVHSGAPFSVRIISDQAFTGNSRTHSSAGGQRPNYVGGPGCSTNAINPGQPSNYVKVQCFSFPAPGELGDAGRNTLTGPRFIELDSSLFKNIGFFHDRYTLQLRAEGFNVTNHTNFGPQHASIFDRKGNVVASGGQLPAPTLTSSRQIQFGAKLTF